jgi:hypothetical protein
MAAGRVVLDGPPAAVFERGAGGVLRGTFVEPPLPAVVGDRLGLGSTPTDDRLVEALRERG